MTSLNLVVDKKNLVEGRVYHPSSSIPCVSWPSGISRNQRNVEEGAKILAASLKGSHDN